MKELNRVLGIQGEIKAKKYLEQKGLKILEQNQFCPLYI